MALQRKWLAAMGIEADKIDEIIEAHLETVNGLKAERDEFKAAALEADKTKQELDSVKAELENVTGKDGYKAKYETLQAEFDKFKSDIDASASAAAKEKAYRDMLIASGVSEKRIDTVMKVTDLSAIEIVDGKLKDVEKLSEGVKKEWADFIVTEKREGAGTETPPGTDDGKDYNTMSMAEYAAARKKK